MRLATTVVSRSQGGMNMVDEPRSDDALSEEDAEALQLKPKRSKLKLVLMIVAAISIVGGVSTGATLYLTGAFSADDSEADDGKQKKDKKKSKKKDTRPVLYHSIEPSFTVNFHSESRARYFQVGVEVMTRDPKVVEALQLHNPVIRHNLIVLFSDRDINELRSKQNKEKLRQQTLLAIKRTLKKADGNDEVEDVFFTTYVMQ